MKKEYLKIGKIVGTHGVRGMVRIEPWADEPAFLKRFSHAFVDGKEIKLSSVTPHKNIVLAKIEGVETIEAAELYRGKELAVKRSEMPLYSGRFFIEEILGAKVIDKNTNKEIGVLSDVLKTGANDVWQVTNKGKDYLFPVIDDLEIDVDIENDIIKLVPLKGIIDDED